MLEQLELLDVADRDFLSSEEEPDDDDDSDDDDESESESDIDKFFTIAAAKNRLFGRKRPLHVVLGAGKGNVMLSCFVCEFNLSSILDSVYQGCVRLWIGLEIWTKSLIDSFQHHDELIWVCTSHFTLNLWRMF